VTIPFNVSPNFPRTTPAKTLNLSYILIRLETGEEIEVDVIDGFYRESDLTISGRPTITIREVFITNGAAKSTDTNKPLRFGG